MVSTSVSLAGSLFTYDTLIGVNMELIVFGYFLNILVQGVQFSAKLIDFPTILHTFVIVWNVNLLFKSF